MADCELLSGCPFFNDKMKESSGIGAVYKKKYCLGDSSTCARFMVFKKLGKASVPDDLYPYMLARAKKLISG
ncbi:MAG: hypothetical protein K8S56_09860 [Candidatus Cloacimonetes bacterium]|nr:hypothetical protein [Candidatus Cloacimonadota bacterium]